MQALSSHPHPSWLWFCTRRNFFLNFANAKAAATGFEPETRGDLSSLSDPRVLPIAPPRPSCWRFLFWFILDECFHAVVDFCLVKDLLVVSTLGRCGTSRPLRVYRRRPWWAPPPSARRRRRTPRHGNELRKLRLRSWEFAYWVTDSVKGLSLHFDFQKGSTD